MFGWSPFDFDGHAPGGGSKKKPEPGTPVFDAPVPAEPVGIGGPINPTPMLGWVDNDAHPMPTSLDPNNPNPKRKGPNEDILQANTNKSAAERLLRPKEGDLSTTNATEAMNLLLEISPDQRGRIMDGLDQKAFESLLERVPHAEREKFSGLLAGSKNPERKLALWKEAHLAHARNDVGRMKGDVGTDDLRTDHKMDKWTDEGSKKQRKKDEKAWRKKNRKALDDQFDNPDQNRTDAQKNALKMHQRHIERVTETIEEVDHDVGALEGRKTPMTLADVDALIERKDLEYDIEKKNDINLTNERGANEEQWTTKNLKTVEQTLGRLPRDYIDRPDGLAEIHRAHGNPGSGVGGDHSGQRIRIYNDGVDETKSFVHGGSPREGVDKDYTDKYGAKIGTMEYVLTHEIGHDVADRNPAAFEKFKAAAGWQEVTAEQMATDGMTPAMIDFTNAQRRKGGSSNSGDRKSYYPNANTDDTYWAADHTAIPSMFDDRSNRGIENKWDYSRNSPAEHFAEVYGKAVHVPNQLHDELVSRPAADAKKARGDVTKKMDALNKIPDTPKNAAKRAEAQQALDKATATMEARQRAVEQRGDEFSIMRNDVFHTDKATDAARKRLSLSVDEKKLAEFDREAAALSTPEQIATLEKKYKK